MAGDASTPGCKRWLAEDLCSLRPEPGWSYPRSTTLDYGLNDSGSNWVPLQRRISASASSGDRPLR